MSARILFYIILFCMACPVLGQAQIKLNPMAEALLVNGVVPEKPDTLEMGSAYKASAPLEVRFSARAESSSSALRYEWQFASDPGFESYEASPRFDEVTTYTFNSTGMHYVRLLVTDTETDETVESNGSYIIQITESELKIPNAFSPNGDGINDVFKVTYKSLASFNAVVFNRWGQKLYQWGLQNIDQGWDGTAHGRQVPVGVYYIIIEAKGADGVTYNHRGDINILR